MASISYWFLSPSVILALAGKLKGWDRTQATPAFDWRKAAVDVVIPARNEESTISLALASLLQQDFPVRTITVIDDGSSDRTAEAVRRFGLLSGRRIGLVVRETPAGKTPAVREQCEASDADALMILDADTILCDSNYLSCCVEELFKNAGVACVCGEVMPLERGRRRQLAKEGIAGQVRAELGLSEKPGEFGEALTVMYRRSLYQFLQGLLYDGHLKLFGSRLSPTGCAVVYRRNRLRECFQYARPRMGDNLTNSEDIFIGHFFTWKGYRNVQVRGVRCESVEPGIFRLPRQLYLWSSAFLQSEYYFRELPLSPLRLIWSEVAGVLKIGKARRPITASEQRRIREQYRWPWGEQHTRSRGRGVGWTNLFATLEKASYPLILILLAIFAPEMALLTVGLEALLCAACVLAVAERGGRFKHAAMMVASTPIRLFSLAVDLATVARCVVDIGVTGNREWRK